MDNNRPDIQVEKRDRRKYKTEYERVKGLLRLFIGLSLILLALLGWALKGNHALAMQLKDKPAFLIMPNGRIVANTGDVK